MMVSFSKYSGCGNDFILIDHRKSFFPMTDLALIQRLCHRQNGIGADGIIFLEESASCDYKMRIFNSDGSEAEMCGNGIRTLMMFIQDLRIGKTDLVIETMHRHIPLHMNGRHVVTHMGPPRHIKWDIQLENHQLHFMDTGVPHAVMFVDTIDRVPVNESGSFFRHHSYFAPKGTNVNFAEIVDEQNIKLRTFERGVEGETLACGTGASAAAAAAIKKKHLRSPVTVHFASKESLTVDCIIQEGQIQDIIQTGPAHKVFTGSFELTNSFYSEQKKAEALCLQS